MNKKIRSKSGLSKRLVAATSVLFLAQSSFALPEAPSIIRTIIEIEEKAGAIGDNATYARPHIPVNHTTGDGRVGLDMKPFSGSGKVQFYLYIPEAIDVPFTDNTTSPGPEDIMWSSRVDVDLDEFIDLIVDSDDPTPLAGDIRHVTIIDKTREFEDGSYQNNPEYDQANDEDVYELLVYATVDWFIKDGKNGRPLSIRKDHLKMQTTPITVRVSNPKTVNAAISSVTVHGVSEKKASANYIHIARLFENKFTNDGKLMVARVGVFTPLDPQYYAPDTGVQTSTNFMDVVYAYSSDGSLDGVNNTVDGFDNIIPISYAPYDPRLNGQYLNDGNPSTEGEFYPFAAFPFRDGSGTIIPKGADFGGSYPWIDTDGRTLAMSTVRANLNDDNVNPRYTNVAAYSGVTENLSEDDGPFQNQSLIGLWTQGKLVSIDNSLNNTDYGIGVELNEQRLVTLYEPTNSQTASLVPSDGKIQIGSGRENSNFQLNGGAGNTTFFDSIENKFNFNDNLKPVMPRDVVWWISNGKSTAQFAFDDYLNKDSFIISKMTGALEFDPAQNGSGRFFYYDGWNDVAGSFSDEVRVANDATAVGSAVEAEAQAINSSSPIVARWNIPANGLVTGANARLEPIAHGGIEGKGVWLESDMSIEYTIPAQPSGSNVAETSWYFGIFVDSREDSSDVRRLITFPDGSSINLLGRETLRFLDTNGDTFTGSNFTLPDAASLSGADVWDRNEWRHFGFQLQAIDDGAGSFSYALDFYHNGFLAYSLDLPEALFQMEPGTLRIGDAPGAVGYKGWYDDFKVFAQNFGPEVCANLARGTLVGFNAGANSAMEDRAALYDMAGGEYIRDMLYHSGQEAYSYSYYAVHYDYTTHDGAHLANIPTGTTSIREQIIFPEAPLFRNTHRPDSSMNSFCVSCHDDTNPSDVLRKGALTLDAGINAQDDDRRQPTQPLRRVFGKIPANWISSGNPASAFDAGSAGALIDEYVLSAQGAGARTARTLSLTDGNGLVLEGIESNYTGSYNASYQIRANLDAGQGSVRFTVTDTATSNSVVTDVDEAPYAIAVPGPGTYTIEADPFTDFGGGIGEFFGVSKTVTNATFGSGGGVTTNTILTDDFNDAGNPFGNWIDGGGGAHYWTNAPNVIEGAMSVFIRNGVSTSHITTPDLSLTTASIQTLRIDFSYRPSGFSNGEYYTLEISTNGGSTYSEVQRWTMGTDFTNDTTYSGEVVEMSDAVYGFTSQTRLRFRCNASSNSDRLFLDEVIIEEDL